MAKAPQKKTDQKPTSKANLEQETPRTYISRTTGWVAGRRVTTGERIDLLPSQAKYEPVDLAGEPKD